MTALVRLFLRLIAHLSDETLARCARLLFRRTERALTTSCADVAGAQSRVLLGVLADARDTSVGRAHNFASIASVHDFRARMPLTTWDDVAADVDRMVAGETNVRTAEDPFFFATTSGTTGRRKLIPVTSSFVAACRATNRVFYRTIALSMPGFVRGRRLAMRSPHVEDLGHDKTAGSITVALSGGLTEAEGALDAVPAAVFHVDDFASRYFLCLRFALQEHVTLCSAVNPSTLAMFARTLEERGAELAVALESGTLGDVVIDAATRATLEPRAGKHPHVAARIRSSIAAHRHARMQDVFPHLVGLVCWKGGSAPWYLDKLKRSYGDVPVLDYGYVASEGCFGAPVSVSGASSVLVPHAFFLELIRERDVDAVRAGQMPTTLLQDAVVGERYFVVVTTPSGLYRCEMNDVVEVTGKLDQAPLVVFRHKGGAVASITGEKIAESHVVHAMTDALAEVPVDLHGFCVAPVLPRDETPPHYVLALDGEAGDDVIANLARAFDTALGTHNDEWAIKRTSLRLGPVVAVRLPHDAMRSHRHERVREGAPDAHIKVPHVSPDGALLLRLGMMTSSPELAALLPCRVTSNSGGSA